MWSLEKLKEWAKPAIKYEELTEIARTATSNTEAKNQALEFTKEQGLDEQVAKACRWLRMVRVRVSPDEFEKFVSSTREEIASRKDRQGMEEKEMQSELGKQFEEDSELLDLRKRIGDARIDIVRLESSIKDNEGYIRRRKREIARELGLVVSSPAELKCERHPDSRFNVVSRLDSKVKDGPRSYIYKCVECEFAQEEYANERFPTEEEPDPTMAYGCPCCSVARGHPKKIEKTPGGFGDSEYRCYVCDLMVGYIYAPNI